MCKESFMVLCEEQHPFITKKKTRFCNAVSVEAQVVVLPDRRELSDKNCKCICTWKIKCLCTINSDKSNGREC